jgi:starch phosphorylase
MAGLSIPQPLKQRHPPEPASYTDPQPAGLCANDPFLVLADIADDLRAQVGWLRRSLLNISRNGYFSSDRSIREYASTIWHVQPLPVSIS